jgi:hypothetical protein
VAEFWALTPRETYAAIDAWKWGQDLAHRRDAWLAWHTAALSRAKRMPTLSRLIEPAEAKPLRGEELEERRRERDELLSRIDLEKLNEAMRKRKP